MGTIKSADIETTTGMHSLLTASSLNPTNPKAKRLQSTFESWTPWIALTFMGPLMDNPA